MGHVLFLRSQTGAGGADRTTSPAAAPRWPTACWSSATPLPAPACPYRPSTPPWPTYTARWPPTCAASRRQPCRPCPAGAASASCRWRGTPPAPGCWSASATAPPISPSASIGPTWNATAARPPCCGAPSSPAARSSTPPAATIWNSASPITTSAAISWPCCGSWAFMPSRSAARAPRLSISRKASRLRTA